MRVNEELTARVLSVLIETSPEFNRGEIVKDVVPIVKHWADRPRSLTALDAAGSNPARDYRRGCRYITLPWPNKDL